MFILGKGRVSSRMIVIKISFQVLAMYFGDTHCTPKLPTKPPSRGRRYRVEIIPASEERRKECAMRTPADRDARPQDIYPRSLMHGESVAQDLSDNPRDTLIPTWIDFLGLVGERETRSRLLSLPGGCFRFSKLLQLR